MNFPLLLINVVLFSLIDFLLWILDFYVGVYNRSVTCRFWSYLGQKVRFTFCYNNEKVPFESNLASLIDHMISNEPSNEILTYPFSFNHFLRRTNKGLVGLDHQLK